MKSHRLFIAALATLASASFAQAHEFDPGGKIVIACQAGNSPRMADVAHAIEDSHYWAPQSARREMLTLARQSCESGSTAVTFVPPPDQRYGTVADRRVTLSRYQQRHEM